MASKGQTALQKLIAFAQTMLRSKDLTVVAFLLCILVIIIVPLPPIILDFLLTISIMLSILIIFIALYITKPTDFSAFPTLLLIVTLFRLALNVATTRMILTEGYRGPSAVSDIITAFGEFTISGNYVIGVIIFSILVLVNLLVVTNGSTRVTEVRARFALDAMPGKQMAIDADFNSGLIDEKEAKLRRAALSQEADFYGSMDGASKFVKGDAIASIIITIINIVGGFLIGMFEYDMGFGQAAQTFTILTIGDGLVGQIPALIIATATGIVATRTAAQENAKESFAQNLVSQLTSQSKTLVIVGLILLLFASIPGLPTFSLLFVGALLLFVAWLLSREDEKSLLSILLDWVNKKFNTNFSLETQATPAEPDLSPAPKAEKTQEEIRKEEEQNLKDALKVDFLELELGFELIGLADQKQGGLLIERVRSMRKKIAHDYGFLMPQIRIRDNLMLPSPNYEVKLKGVVIGEGMVMPTKFLALDTGVVGSKIEGVEVQEPAFGMNAVWIDAKDKEDAIIAGYTVFDPSSVISTHISELVTRNAQEFITRDEVNDILSRMSDDYPALIEEARKISSIVRMVLQALLAERVPIRDMLTILETTIDKHAMGMELDVIIEGVRTKLARVITQTFADSDGVLKFIGFTPLDEEYLKARIKNDPDYGQVLALTAAESEKFTLGLKNAIEAMKEKNIYGVIATDVKLRRVMVKEVRDLKARIPVVSYAEIDPNAKYEQVGIISPNF
ncbi:MULTISPECIES: flagellar biosynthesis protein FlhA [Helicobacter]|uniref:Flagellar biosynthesis protein FlhA n=2 Tax=Helicobacter TaxID=209 RepID=A0A377J5W9_9HELI|nr:MULTISPECIES: flagellar biosynthesis protein FlhA [Helicobacter]MDL0081001.1 flagellar biosynthesis protein FlhA [Helicobacter sp. CPD2-1]MDL0083069.1 flagellar biosynthesis protein FlhA [Helicobacter sp. XJK30-2]STO97664.1 flagellar biosynthesis protein FlhA [Helicobacter canis]